MTHQLSLLEQQRLTHPGATDLQHLERWAADVIRELELKPPIDPAVVASYLGVARVEVDDLDVAGCLLCQQSTMVIKVRRTDSAGRRRFTICHECSHTFFPGYARTPQYRCNPSTAETSLELERLCDIGASELLLPRTTLVPDLRDVGFGVSGLMDLSDHYDASFEAVGHRIVTVSSEPIAFLVLEVMHKKHERTGDPPALRVRASRATAGFPYIPRLKSVSPGTPLYRAAEGEVVHEITTLEGVCSQSLQDVEVSARLIPYSGRTRVLALVRPTRTNGRR